MVTKEKCATKDGQAVPKPKRQPKVRQADAPMYTLEDALRIPLAIRDNYAKAPTKPADVALALGVSARSSSFENLCSASVAYGLTEGTCYASTISLTELGRNIVAPTDETMERNARKEAVLLPRVFGEFLNKYDGSPIPREEIACNVLETMGVPTQATQRAFKIILTNGRDVGILSGSEGNYVVLMHDLTDQIEAPQEKSSRLCGSADPSCGSEPVDKCDNPDAAINPNHRVFITHGRNRDIVGQLKELLSFGGFSPVVAEENESTSKPVPEKVMDDMRSCFAGIIHVGSEQRLIDESGAEHIVLNSNVLIEIGAAMAIYKNRFILLVENGISLPSNLQGLYEVRYEGDKLDYEATMKLLKAFSGFRF